MIGIFNAFGQTIIQIEENENSWDISVEDLKTGVYYLMIDNNTVIRLEKI